MIISRFPWMPLLFNHRYSFPGNIHSSSHSQAIADEFAEVLSKNNIEGIKRNGNQIAAFRLSR